jgi:HEAT repeat protein
MRNIALALVAMKQRSSEATLLRLTEMKDSGTRMYAAQGLGQLKSQTAIPRLVAMLSDSVPFVRREAARAIGALKVNSAAAQLFETARAETDPEARAAELIAVGQVGGKKQIDLLETVIEVDGRESTRRAAARALCTLGAQSGFDYAKKMFASDDGEDHVAAVKLFEDSKPEDAARMLQPLLQSKDVRLAATAAHTLYNCGDTKMLEWLVVHSAKASIEHRLIYEQELESIGITDDQRQEILLRNNAAP